MTKDEKVPDWFLWAWEHFPGILMVCVLLGTIVVGGAIYVESRLSDNEERLNFSPPSSSTPPDLAAYDAQDMTPEQLANRHLVYVPVYSHIYFRGGSPSPLETTLSIRNVDAKRTIYIESVDYFNTTGDLERKHVDRLI